MFFLTSNKKNPKKAGDAIGPEAQEQRSREESRGVIEDGDVGSVGSVDQGRGSQEGDTVGGGGGDVIGEDRQVLI